MDELEKIKFRIGISGTYWNTVPEYSISVDNTLILRKLINQPTDVTTFVEFEHELSSGNHKLTIRLENKTPNDTIQSDDKTTILKDMLLNIISIEIDNINLRQLIWDESTFIPDDPQFPTLKNCVNLGWNGSYEINFSSPFYLWLLEKL